jgi:hypothetical protein
MNMLLLSLSVLDSNGINLSIKNIRITVVVLVMLDRF